MGFSEDFKRSLSSIKNKKIFIDRSLVAFEYQFQTNALYREYCNYHKKTPKIVKNLEEIPFLPVEFFKSHVVKSDGKWKEAQVFKSSGTTSTGRSQHYIRDLTQYHLLAKHTFENMFGTLSNLKLIALLPSYQEQGDSSLISMVDYFIRYATEGSGHYKSVDIARLMSCNNKKIIIGISYALLDLIEKEKISPSANNIIIETGGMKGRRKEIIRDELHGYLKNVFQVNAIWSEYGMTELQSQAYGENGFFRFPVWAKCMIRSTNDPFSYVKEGKTGGINVIDLANIDSCCFIETKDLGKIHTGYFEVLGRFDNSDIRGCSLMI